MNDKDDLSVWNDFIKKEFRVENKYISFSNAELNDDNRGQIFKKKKKLPLPGLLTKRTIKKLATRKIKTNATLDLHGLNIEKARVAFLSFLEFACSSIDLNVSISPNTLAVSARVKGVEELKCVWFLPAKY